MQKIALLILLILLGCKSETVPSWAWNPDKDMHKQHFKHHHQKKIYK